MSMLEYLNLDYNLAIGKGRAVSLIKSLYTSKVKTLRLSGTGIGEEDCECLSELAKSNLELLTVGDNKLSSESVEMITRGVAHGSSLRILNMSHSQVSVAAVVDLASLLSEQSDCKLEELYLLRCNVSSEGVVALATALCKNITLCSLHLDYNPIGQQGAAAIAQMLPQNRTLRRIHLCDDSIGEEGARQLVSSLDQNSTLDKMSLPPKYKHMILISSNRIDWC